MLPGDLYFASGDLLRKDAFGFYYWVDRLGDTFRLVMDGDGDSVVPRLLSLLVAQMCPHTPAGA